ncbi:MAG: RNA polymerase sigma-70 factor [Tannerella sp.]|jgi:RNA polymerase sigma-70 factor (ECF subfamily)|nr:RNA polymerase sigma-70 factor [Tannerella sp.]
MENMNEMFDFEEIYLSWFAKMKHFAREYVVSEEDAENIVQDVFMELWEKPPALVDRTRLTAYLFTSVKNRSLNCLRRRIMEQKAANRMQNEHQAVLRMNLDSLAYFDHAPFDEDDVKQLISQALLSLPEQCRRVFVMSKIEGKKQKDIAAELHISINTVETQIGIAYKKLRVELKKYLPLFAFFFPVKIL